MKNFMLLATTFALLTIGFSVKAHETSSIGRATIVIGSAYINKDGEKIKISRGTTFNVEDEIVTRSNGHVHIRFNDKGILSVRPNSKLVIEAYNYNEKKPELSTVKFNLLKGVARSVSGKAAKAARSRFRMNTPIAAIGVRGTDFVISANSEKIKAFVNEGTIVVSPFSSNCLAATLGPCASDAVELHGNTNKLLELRNQQSLPVITSINNESLPAFLYATTTTLNTDEDDTLSTVTATETQTAANDNETKKDNESTVVVVENDASAVAASEESKEAVTSDTLTTSAASVTVEVLDNSNESSTEIDTTIDTDTNIDIISDDDIEVLPAVELESPTTSTPDSELITPETELSYITPTIPLNSDALTNRQLVWGRWSEGVSANDRISTTYAEASEGRRITIGDVSKGLFREGDGSETLAADLGNVSFDLHFADVDFFADGEYSQMTVNSGYLLINFNDKGFVTGLSLDHDSTGAIDFNMSGDLSDNGIFINTDDAKRISGAVSFDGSEAGYLFSETLENGVVEGSTLWGTP